MNTNVQLIEMKCSDDSCRYTVLRSYGSGSSSGSGCIQATSSLLFDSVLVTDLVRAKYIFTHNYVRARVDLEVDVTMIYGNQFLLTQMELIPTTLQRRLNA